MLIPKRHKHRRGSPLYVTPAFDLFLRSYDLVKANLGIFALLFFLPLVIGLSNGTWVVESRRSWNNDVPVAANTLGASGLPAWAWGGLGVALIFALAIGIVLQIMTHAAQLKASQEHKPKLADLWQVVRTRGWQMLGLYAAVALMALISFVPLIVLGLIGVADWPLLLAALAIIICALPFLVVMRRYFVAPYVLLEHEGMSVWQIMDKSAEITRRDSWSVYSIFGVMVVFELFGALPLIGWIIAFALRFFYNLAPALRYQELKRLG